MSEDLKKIQLEFKLKENQVIENIIERKKIESFADLPDLEFADLYPEYNFNTELIGYFDPYVVGHTGEKSFGDIGKGASILNLIPFYNRLVVRFEVIPEDMFEMMYGVSFQDMQVLVDAGKVLPLLPESIDRMLLFHETAGYLLPLYRRNFPMECRFFYLQKKLLFEKGLVNERMETFSFFMKIIGNEIDVFKTSFGKGAFLVLCNRALYRGDPYLIYNLVSLAEQGIETFKSMGANDNHAEELTIWLLDARERLLTNNFKLKGLTGNYSRFGFDWARSEFYTKIARGLNNFPKIAPSEIKILQTFFPSYDSNIYDYSAILRDKYIHEPIDTVGDIRKYLFWVERSNNVQENYKILKKFDDYINLNKFREIAANVQSDLKDVVQELNEDIKRVKFMVKTSKRIIEIGTTVGTTIAGKFVGSALTGQEVASIFSMCGALAGLTLANKSADDIAKSTVKRITNGNLPFLLWKKDQ